MSRLLDPTRADFLIKTASKIFDANPLKSERTRYNVWCRTVLYLILNNDGNSYKAIGLFFGKDRATVVYSIKKHPDLLKYDKEYEMYFNEFLISIKDIRVTRTQFLKDISFKITESIECLNAIGYDIEESTNYILKCIEESKLKTA